MLNPPAFEENFFKWLLLLQSVVLIVSGCYSIRFPERVLEIDKKYTPARSWELLQRIGFINPRNAVVSGYVAILLGAAFFFGFAYLVIAESSPVMEVR